MFARTHKRIRVRFDLDEEASIVDGDSGQLEHVLLNLLLNAEQALADDGRIDVGVRCVSLAEEQAGALAIAAGDYVCLELRDNGSGIDPAILDRIFDPFFTTKEPGRGSGLGLASADRIVRNHAGAIEVESKVGEGTCFHVYLPAHRGVALAPAPASGRAELPRGHETILLVDDEPMVLDVARPMLERLGYRVLTAGNGEAGAAKLAALNGAIDLVILDMVMPGLSGSATFTRLREIDGRVRILLSSGYGAEDAAALLARGSAGFIGKPYRIEELARRVREALERPVR